MGLKDRPVKGYVSTLDAGESQEVYLLLPGYADKQDVSYSGLTKMVGVCIGNHVFADVFGGDDVYGYFQEYVDVEAEEQASKTAIMMRAPPPVSRIRGAHHFR